MADPPGSWPGKVIEECCLSEVSKADLHRLCFVVIERLKAELRYREKRSLLREAEEIGYRVGRCPVDDYRNRYVL